MSENMERCVCDGCARDGICVIVIEHLRNPPPSPPPNQPLSPLPSPPRNILSSLSYLVPRTPPNVRQAHAVLTNEYQRLELVHPYSTESPQIIFDEDMGKTTKHRFHVLKQLRVFTCTMENCRSPGGLRSSDFIGERGIQCLHCKKMNKVWRKPSNYVNSFDQISDHFEKCKVCPQDITMNLEVLRDYHPEEKNNNNLLGTQGNFYKTLHDRIQAKSTVELEK